jgi:hypothetical protein
MPMRPVVRPIEFTADASGRAGEAQAAWLTRTFAVAA